MFVLYLPAQKSFDGFPLAPWFEDEEPRRVTVDILFLRDKKDLKVTINDAMEDDVNERNLLLFLKEKSVIDNIFEWELVEKRDTEGLTFLEENFVTLIFSKMSIN